MFFPIARTLALVLSVAQLATAQTTCTCECPRDACFSLLAGSAYYPDQATVDDCRSYVVTTTAGPPSTETETVYTTSTFTGKDTVTVTIFDGPTATTTKAEVTITETTTVLTPNKRFIKAKRQVNTRTIPSYASGICTDGPNYARACGCIILGATSTIVTTDNTSTVTETVTGTITDAIIDREEVFTTVPGTNWVTTFSGTTTITETVNS
ncbi:hypothetical protein H072_9303 [Dactylellina haptotyla CBS 200.50]|uniref:Uncharacterized protein n=1 Tax=Dactylellina haptotyla (strain CBS 200.50) TaxID=1284197 RepID=S8A7E3_DACHA|nr:hypothetical protein H072_9303 [Dactylellina haptotyla CBS 200.50]